MLHTVAHAWLANRHWMAWNLVLAVVPAVLAVVLFRPGRRRTAPWWIGAVAFGLFLPNAPYVVTDLIHLPENVAQAPSRSSVLFGFLPAYGVFIGAGLLAYAYCLHRLRIWLGARPLDPGWVAAEIVVHAVSAAGVLVGRLSRLNSWDAVVRPHHTAWTSLSTLSQPRSLVIAVAFASVLFVACRLMSVGAAIVSRWVPPWLRLARS